MRISPKEVTRIRKNIDSFFPDFKVRCYLFGSRLDDQKRGGDIDLLLICEDEHFDKVWEKKFILKEYLEDDLGDQKVDVVVTTQLRINADAFLKSISCKLIELY